MSIAIVHYHLRHGGVTRVIEAQSQALTRLGIEHIVLSGTPYEGSHHLPVSVIPLLKYCSQADQLGGGVLADALREAATRALGEPPSLWHIHNPTLGKNCRFPAMLRKLADSQEHMLLQFHDFAEDGRPGNYRLIAEEEQLYLTAPLVHYAFINSRDRNLLINAGLAAERAHLLPNAITPPTLPGTGRSDSSRRTVLYPVRGIRRKNLGEFCLLAGLSPEDTRFALTLAPANPQWRPVYNDWAVFAAHHHLPVLFDVVGSTPPAPGVGPSYENWLAHATHLTTSSIAEGFGLAFLEPLALRKPLFGRDLPEITIDFKAHDIKLGTLYDDFLVPLDWINLEQLRHFLSWQLQSAYDAYRQPYHDEYFDLAWDSFLLGDFADFGNLPESLQRDVISMALEHPDDVMVGMEGQCQSAVDWLEAALATPDPSSDPSALAPYSLASYSDRLRGIYDSIRAATPEPCDWLQREAVLHQFLEPERFHFLRT
jgi:glycosyltransferase involved in cell wall biosynthesis